VQLAETNLASGDTAAINRLIAISRAKPQQLGGDPTEHLNAIGIDKLSTIDMPPRGSG
jgi:hypothetical protein